MRTQPSTVTVGPSTTSDPPSTTTVSAAGSYGCFGREKNVKKRSAYAKMHRLPRTRENQSALQEAYLRAVSLMNNSPHARHHYRSPPPLADSYRSPVPSRAGSRTPPRLQRPRQSKYRPLPAVRRRLLFSPYAIDTSARPGMVNKFRRSVSSAPAPRRGRARKTPNNPHPRRNVRSPNLSTSMKDLISQVLERWRLQNHNAPQTLSDSLMVGHTANLKKLYPGLSDSGIKRMERLTRL